MKAIDAIKEAASREGVPTTHIGPRMGNKHTYVASIASRDSSPKVDTVAKMADAIGYALVLVRNDEVPDDAIRITHDDRIG